MNQIAETGRAEGLEKDWWNQKESKVDHATTTLKPRNAEAKGRMNEEEVDGRHDASRKESLNLITNQRGNRGG